MTVTERRIRALCLSAASAAALTGATALAEEERTLNELLSGWGVTIDTVEVEVETLSPGTHVMRAAGGAVLVSIGAQGVLIVDDQFPQTVPRIRQAIRELGGGDVDFVINTHWHFDHADGNALLGGAGSHIIAHSNSRRQMISGARVSYTQTYYEQPPSPAEALPVVTFDESITLYFNDQRIDVMHFGPGHTDGDAAVFFRGANVVHVGDLYNARYPYIDAGNGGSLAGLIAVCRSILDQMNDDMLVVSGHAPVANYTDLQDYVEMLETMHAKLSSLKSSGLSLDEVLAAGPTAEFDADHGDPTLFVTMAYRSLATGAR
jgi:glyoxylase-like metal-dependent hydrolase (beta-lactamase superfamily II)